MGKTENFLLTDKQEATAYRLSKAKYYAVYKDKSGRLIMWSDRHPGELCIELNGEGYARARTSPPLKDKYQDELIKQNREEIKKRKSR